jgi:hypothetical protein
MAAKSVTVNCHVANDLLDTCVIKEERWYLSDANDLYECLRNRGVMPAEFFVREKDRWTYNEERVAIRITNQDGDTIPPTSLEGNYDTLHVRIYPLKASLWSTKEQEASMTFLGRVTRMLVSGGLSLFLLRKLDEDGNGLTSGTLLQAISDTTWSFATVGTLLLGSVLPGMWGSRAIKLKSQ